MLHMAAGYSLAQRADSLWHGFTDQLGLWFPAKLRILVQNPCSAVFLRPSPLSLHRLILQENVHSSGHSCELESCVPLTQMGDDSCDSQDAHMVFL